MKKKNKKLPTWTSVYPQGCKQGDEEQEFFIALSRHPKWRWRSVAAIASESRLTKERVEEIIQKYWKKGMVFQNPKDEDQWAYWERVPELLLEDPESITSEDHEDRIK